MVMYGANGQSEKVHSEFSGLTTRQYFSMPNIAVMYGAGDAIETQSPSSVSTRPVVSVGPAAASDDLIGPPKKLCSSMPNIHVTFGATEATGFKRIPAQASVEDKNDQITKPVDVVYTSLDSIASSEGGIEFTVPTTQRRRCTWWKRTKKFARRLFCCA
jgi:hypothetical protein